MNRVVLLDQGLGGGGAERVLCSIMRSMDPSEFDVHLILISHIGDLEHLIPSHVTVHVLGIKNTRKALKAYLSKVRVLRPQVVFTSKPRAAILAVLGKLLCPSYKLITRYPSMPSLEMKDGVLKGWRFWLTVKLYRFVDVVIAQSDEMGHEVSQYFQVNPSKIHALSNPLDTAYIDQSVLNEPSPFNGEMVNIVAAGRITPEKGFDVLVRSFAMACDSRDDLLLHILGRDSVGLKEELELLAESLGVEDRIVFHGFVSNPYPYYKFCDLFVLSSRREGCPNVLLECLYLEKQVVATECIPIIKRLVPETRGITVPVEDVEGVAKGIIAMLDLPQQPLGKSLAFGDAADFVSLFREAARSAPRHRS